MSKWYEIKSIEVKHWLVEVEDNETEGDAIDAVADTAMSDADDQTVEAEGQVREEELENMKRNTDRSRILYLEG